MGRIRKAYKKALVDINKINFKNILFDKIISYPPAGNDVFECLGNINGRKQRFILKSERGAFANFSNEINILNELSDMAFVPKILEWGTQNNRVYLALTYIKGNKLSDLFRFCRNKNRKKYLYLYGESLAKIHNYSVKCKRARQRNVNEIPIEEDYNHFTEWERNVVNFLKENKPSKVEYNAFIHGDPHYGNFLWKNHKIVGILDWEYAGLGFQEYDIAWALVLRPGQRFMDNENDIESFLRGYKSIKEYNIGKLRWAYINIALHFYLMNKDRDLKYSRNIKKIINGIIEGKGIL